MRRVCCMMLLLSSAWIAGAQSNADLQKMMEQAKAKMKAIQNDPEIARKMQQAQQQMDRIGQDTAVRNELKGANAKLQALKKDHPELGDVTIPDISKVNTQLPDFDSISNSLDATGNKLYEMTQMVNQTIPKQDLLHQAAHLLPLDAAALKALAQSVIKASRTGANIFLLAKLDTLAERKDLNVAGTGLFYLSLGLSPGASAYLIAKGVLLHPSDPYAASGLGVYYRDKGDLQRALQCYFYADNLLPGSMKSPYIYANIGWASFYYGDFDGAKEYFNKALAISGNFQPALEGNANVAYAEGDIKALFQCLARELEASLASSPRALGAGGGNSSGPSSGFTAICGGATGSDQASNPSDNHTFDNLGKEDDSPEQDPPPGADVTFPSLFTPVFNVKDVKDIIPAYKQFAAAFPKASQKLAAIREEMRKINAPFHGVSHFDEQGNLVHDRDYTKFSNLHGMIQVLFERRVDQLIVKFNKGPLKQLSDNVITSFLNLQQTVKDCKDKRCLCQAYTHIRQEGNSLLESSLESWEKLYDGIIKEARWYLKNDAPIVSRVHDPKCNEVLNLDREASVRQAILAAYGCWGGIMEALSDYSGAAIASETCPVYGVEARVISTPNPFSKRPKHIKEFADPNCKDMDFPIGVLGSITENCHFTKFTIGPKIGPFQLGFTYTTNKDVFTGKVKDDIYAKNNDFDHGYGATAGIAYKFDEVVEVDGAVGGSVNYNDKGQATGYTGSAEAGAAMDFGIAKLGGKANTTWQMDADGNITGHSNSLSGSASVGGNVPAEEDDPNQKSSGFGVGGDYTSTSNYDANGNYIGGNNTTTVSLQQSGTTNAGRANAEGAGQNNLFGVQINQVIQVVAGAEQTGPLTIQ